MSKEEFLKIQTCVLKVNIHCEGCKQKVKKILQKIDGVYTTTIDSEQGKVTVSGNVDPPTLIKKLSKNGKKAELLGPPKGNNNSTPAQNQFKNLQIDNAKAGNNGNKKGAAAGGGNNNNQPKVGGQNPQIKGFQEMKLAPQFGNGGKDLKLPQVNGKEQKPAGKFMLPPEEEGLTEDEYDDDDDDDYDDDVWDGLDDDLDHAPAKMKPQMPNMVMIAGPQQLKAGNNGKKGGGGGGNIPVQINPGGDVKGGKKGGVVVGGGGGGNGNNSNGGGGGKGGKNGGGQPGQNKNVVGGGGGKEGGGLNHGPHGMPNMMMMPMSGGAAGMVPAGNMPVGHMGNHNPPISQIANLAVQGLPAMGGGGGGGGGSSGAVPAGYFHGGGGEPMGGNSYYQQQLAAMMMNQQRANGNERFQPMMYARPPPAVNYMPPYPYSPIPGDQYSMFSDENAGSCTVM